MEEKVSKEPCEVLEVGSVVSKSGSNFKVLDVRGGFALCEQRISDRVVAYEVSKVICSRRMVDFKNRVYGGLYQTIPSTNAFGMHLLEKSFSANNYKGATRWLDFITNEFPLLSKKEQKMILNGKLPLTSVVRLLNDKKK